MFSLTPFDKLCFGATVLFCLASGGYFLQQSQPLPWVQQQHMDFSQTTQEIPPEPTVTPQESFEESFEELVDSPETSNSTVLEDETPSPSTSLDKIDLNTASLTELQTLSGIGEQRATDIIAYRDAIGGFTQLEQIMDISGIGTSTFEKIEEFITITP